MKKYFKNAQQKMCGTTNSKSRNIYIIVMYNTNHGEAALLAPLIGPLSTRIVDTTNTPPPHENRLHVLHVRQLM